MKFVEIRSFLFPESTGKCNSLVFTLRMKLPARA